MPPRPQTPISWRLPVPWLSAHIEDESLGTSLTCLAEDLVDLVLHIVFFDQKLVGDDDQSLSGLQETLP